MKSQKKSKLSNIVENVRTLNPNQKLVVLKALHSEHQVTQKDIRIMEWALNAIKSEQRNNKLLKNGLAILDKVLEQQNKKS
jgi:hypothetical protein